MQVQVYNVTEINRKTEDSLSSWTTKRRGTYELTDSLAHVVGMSIPLSDLIWNRRYCLRLWRPAPMGQSPSAVVEAITPALYLRPARFRQGYITEPAYERIVAIQSSSRLPLALSLCPMSATEAAGIFKSDSISHTLRESLGLRLAWMPLVKRVHRLAYRNIHLIPNHHGCGEVSNAHFPSIAMNGVDQVVSVSSVYSCLIAIHLFVVVGPHCAKWFMRCLNGPTQSSSLAMPCRHTLIPDNSRRVYSLYFTAAVPMLIFHRGSRVNMLLFNARVLSSVGQASRTCFPHNEVPDFVNIVSHRPELAPGAISLGADCRTFAGESSLFRLACRSRARLRFMRKAFGLYGGISLSREGSRHLVSLSGRPQLIADRKDLERQ
ncbi:hypothetical protein AB1N83_003386 [Pleurotus pulmonarius]